MNWINEISYGTISGGAKNGLVMYELVFSGKPDPISSDVVETFETIVSHRAHNCRRVHLTGDLPQQDNGCMLGLCESLREAGFLFFITTKLPMWSSWMTHAYHLVVELSSPKWAPFKFSELVYDLATKDQREPELPDNVFNRNTDLLYLRPNPKMSNADVFDYIVKSSRTWNIYTSTPQKKEIIYKREEA